jgi:hypothetical protein
MTSSIVLTSKSLAFIKEKCSVDSDWTALIWCPVLVDHYTTRLRQINQGRIHNKGGGGWMALEIVIVAAQILNRLI